MGNALIYQDYEDPPGPGKGMEFFKGLKMKTVELFFKQMRECETDLKLDVVERKVSFLTWRNYSRIVAEVREVIETDADHYKRTIWNPATMGYVMRNGLLPPLWEPEAPPTVKTDRYGNIIPDDFTDDDASDTEEDTDDEAEKSGSDEDGEGEDENGNKKLRPAKSSTEEGEGASEKKAANGSDSNEEDENDGDGSAGGSGEGEKKRTKVIKKNSGRPKRDTRWVGEGEVGKVDKPKLRKGKSEVKEEDDDNDLPIGERRQKWNPKLLSPIFFGYHHVTTVMEKAEKDAKANTNEAAEKRAIVRAQEARASMLSEATEMSKKQSDTRLKKLEDIERRYNAATSRREDELTKNKRDLPESGFLTFKRKWDSEYDAAEAAYIAEVGQLRYIHSEKTDIEEAKMVKRLQEMEAFKDAEKQEMPAAERLEEIARIEISRWIEELDTCSKQLEESRKEYAEMRDELEVMMEKGITKRNEKQLRELRSVVNHAESSVRTRQKALEDALLALEDSEFLFDRALRIKKQQDELLPLFRLLSREELPSKVRADFFCCALTILMSGTYEQKWNSIFNLFDSTNNLNGYFDSEIIHHMLILFQETLYRLNYIAFEPRKEEIANTIKRSFIDLGLQPGRLAISDRLTQYETRMLIMQIIGHSNMLSKILGFKKNAFNTGRPHTTYQRNKMGALALLSRGISTPANTKYRQHYEITKYWKEREPKYRQLCHERAMSMGEEDPLKPDYSRYMAKEKKKYRATIAPLDHGHLSSTEFMLDTVKKEAVTKIQAVVRARRDRQMAELAAKKQAFYDARDQANEAMKQKIVLEFKKREDLTGMPKMKWDASVRMRQAKLKSAGQKVNRGNTVVLMMEEAISKAREEVTARFAKLEERESFASKNLEHRVNIYGLDVKINKELLSAFDLKPKSAVDQSAIEEMPKAKKIAEYKEEDDASITSLPKEKDEDGNTIATIPESEKHTDKAPILGGIDLIRAEEMLKGVYIPDASGKGESGLETDLKLFLRGSEPTVYQLLTRLRSINSAFTIFKTSGFLAEFPSKRLLIKYIESTPEAVMLKDLRLHFKFTKEQSNIQKTLVTIAASDFERGYLMEALRELQDHLEYGVRSATSRQLTASIDAIEVILLRKLETNEMMTEAKVLESDVKRATKYFQKFESEVNDILAEIFRQQEVFKRSMLSVSETYKRLRVTQLLKQRREGNRIGETDPDVILDDRQNWVIRLKTALQIQEMEIKDTETKWAEVRTVCREFVDIATADALILISEHNQPRFRKTIHVARELGVNGTAVDGRDLSSGRGIEGKYFYYEAHNIEYFVCEDYNGIFNGQDEQAMKMLGGKERLGALEYLKTHTERLNSGLVITVDFAGYRVVGVAKLPIQHVNFNDEGEIKKISEDRVHGLSLNGETFTNKNKVGSSLLKKASQRLHLSEHHVRGIVDTHSQITCGGGDLQVFRGQDEEFYMKNYWRCFPPEHPGVTTHLNRTPRDQSVLWRKFRPEFCRRYDAELLSPDALTLPSHKAVDQLKQDAGVFKATTYLVEELIPNFAENISSRDFLIPLSDGLGLDLTAELHSRGISMRHLGLIRSLLWRTLPGTMSIYFSEKCLRPTEDLRHELEHGDVIKFTNVSLEFVVHLDKNSTPPIEIVHGDLPISTVFMGQSIKGQATSAGFINTTKNADALRSVLLGEMVARTVKNLVRLQCRNYARKTKVISTQVTIALLIDFLNIVTGAHETAAHGLQTVIYEALRERFGPLAVRPSERPNLHKCLAPVTLFTIKRILSMMGAQLNPNCLSDFLERPLHFYFCEADLLEVAPIVRHNIPIMTFADATLITLRANKVAEVTYANAIKADAPKLVYRMFERKGSRSAVNTGTMGSKLDGMYSRGCNLWLPGPIPSDPFSRCVQFSQETQSFLDLKFDTTIVPQSFSSPYTIEIFARCSGGADSLRVIFTCGRYSLIINREGYFCFIMIDGLSEITIKVCACVMDQFQHLIFTYDGVTMRGYVNGELRVETEVEYSMKLRLNVFEDEIKESRADIEGREAEEKAKIKNVSQLQAEAFFAGKQGVAFLKSETQEIMESAEFQALGIGKNADSDQAAMKEKRTVALKQAKAKYTTDVYVKNVKEVKNKYRTQMNELNDKEQKVRDSAAMKSRTGLRIGASSPSGNSFTATDVFHGEICYFQFYSYALQLDRIREHFSSAQSDRTRDSQRLHAMAAVKYEEALSLASDDVLVLKGFAQSLVEYLKVELTGTNGHGVSKGKVKVMQAIDKFKAIGVPEGIAAILKALPLEAEYGILAVKAFSAIKFLDRSFFMRHLNMTRKDLVHIPAGFALDAPQNTKEFIDVAAGMYAEVVRDHDLSFSYGETDLSWMSALMSSELIVAIVKHAREDKSLKMLRVGELFKAVGRTKLSVTDEDIAVMCSFASLTVGYDLTGCHLLTNASLSSMSRAKNIRIISFENCPLIDNIGIRYLEELSEKLEVLNVCGLVNLTDDGLAPLFRKCKRLTSVNVGNCPHVTHEVLHLLALNNHRLAALHAANTQISDSGMSLICSALNEKAMVSLDISMCRDISDYGAISIGESVPALKFLNINGCSRISDKGTRALCAKCWYLQTFSLEDVFLLDDNAFRFDLAYDGRLAADENMLKNLVTLNLRDCVNVTDVGIQALSERCRKVETLILRGCDKITNTALIHLMNAYEDNFPMCDAFKTLDLSYCAGISAEGVLQILPACGILEDLRLSGMVSVDDNFIQEMCIKAGTIQRLAVEKCVFMSDAALCSMADYLWLEYLDVTGCRRITDDGIEVVTVACNGIFSLLLSGVHRITSRSINAISRNCTVIQELEVQKCPLLLEKALDDLQNMWPHLRIKSDFVNKMEN